ncbi:MAG: enoyl-CoA hydratase/isomerase family protein [Thermoanaerobaculia bacterium]
MSDKRARLELTDDGKVARVYLAAPKPNIVDIAMMEELTEIVDGLTDRRDLVAVVLGAEGPNFSYGASVPEHLPEQIGDALAALHGLIGRFLELPAPTIAAVRGQCLGGGLELVLACDLILAEETARLGVPEIKLGVFPPAASALLPPRLGSGRAAALILTGTTWTGTKAAAAGLVTRVAPEGELDSALDAWLSEEFLDCSPTGLLHAARAVRRASRQAVAEQLPDLERQYLEELMTEPDAVEGIQAFLDKREPQWSPGGRG